jgi:hypothetical protein
VSLGLSFFVSFVMVSTIDLLLDFCVTQKEKKKRFFQWLSCVSKLWIDRWMNLLDG